MEPTILERSEHPVSRKHISESALRVLYRLNERGYKAYLAGGCVRDLLLGREPKDFDVATDATPQQVKRCFRNCRLIGRRFRLAHVIFNDEVIEVATFRAPTPVEEEPDDENERPGDEEMDNHEDVAAEIPEDAVEDTDSRVEEMAPEDSRVEVAPVEIPGEIPEEAPAPAPSAEHSARAQPDRVVDESGVVIRDNVFGSPEEDAFRRDFTINALFYNIDDFSIIDYVGGLVDIEKRIVRAIGDPDQRYQEDPVRMIRALRFASTLHLDIEDECYQAILRQREQMTHASHARMFEEILKFFNCGAMCAAFAKWEETGLLDVMFPGLAPWWREKATEDQKHWQYMAFEQMDKWKKLGIKASPELAYSFFLAPFIFGTAAELEAQGQSPHDALVHGCQQVQQVLAERILIPKRILFKIYDILKSQRNFENRRSPRQIQSFVRRHYFRDALVFYKFDLFVKGENRNKLLAAWQRDFENAPEPDPEPRRPRRRPRRRRRR